MSFRSRPLIVQDRELTLEAYLDELRVGAGQRVLGWQVLVRPDRGGFACAQAVQFVEQAIPLQRGLVGRQNGSRDSSRNASAAAVRHLGRARVPV